MVRVRFIKSGVSFGYAYNFGEVGVVRSEHLERLVKAGVVEVLEVKQTVEPPKYETPERNKPKYEKRNK